MRIAVTGAAGRVGSRVLRIGTARGHEIVALDIARVPPTEGSPAVEPCDLADADALARAIAGCDAVIHLAAVPSPRDDARLVFDTNVSLTFALLLVVRRLRIERTVLASSASALGFAWSSSNRRPRYLPMDEAHPVEPADHYGLSKQIVEELGREHVRESGLSAVALRFPRVLDEDAARSFRDGTIEEGGPASPMRDFWSYVMVDDVAEAFLDAAEAPLDGFALVTVTAPDTLSDEPTETLIARDYPGVPLTRPIPGATLAWDLRAADVLLGRLPSRSFRDQRNDE